MQIIHATGCSVRSESKARGLSASGRCALTVSHRPWFRFSRQNSHFLRGVSFVPKKHLEFGCFSGKSFSRQNSHARGFVPKIGAVSVPKCWRVTSVNLPVVGRCESLPKGQAFPAQGPVRKKISAISIAFTYQSICLKIANHSKGKKESIR